MMVHLYFIHGSVNQALLGKHYTREMHLHKMHLHKMIAETLLHMMIQRCVENHTNLLNGLEHVVNITTEQENEDFVIHEMKLDLEEWDVDPWDLSQPNLSSLCTGYPATEQVVNSLHTAHDEGNECHGRSNLGPTFFRKPITAQSYQKKETQKICDKGIRSESPEAGGENPNRALTTTCRRAIESDRYLKPRAGFSRRTVACLPEWSGTRKLIWKKWTRIFVEREREREREREGKIIYKDITLGTLYRDSNLDLPEAECSVVFEWRSAFACPVESYPRINFVVNGDYHSSTAGVMVGLLVLAVVLSVAYLYLRKPANRSQLRSKLSSLCPGRRHEGFFQYSRDRCGQSYHHPAGTLAKPGVEGLRLAKGAQRNHCKGLFLVCGHGPWLKATEEASLLIHDPAESDSDDDELLGV
uniref:Uncharacterized protein n=1 Tax=Timema douglasi TaxID=61478 RepID=A0A7R8Z803_TIMDO|nr:unnamed protein product [Timema douglasi]